MFEILREVALVGQMKELHCFWDIGKMLSTIKTLLISVKITIDKFLLWAFPVKSKEPFQFKKKKVAQKRMLVSHNNEIVLEVFTFPRMSFWVKVNVLSYKFEFGEHSLELGHLTALNAWDKAEE